MGINFDEHLKRKKEFTLKRLLFGDRRSIKTRPRDPEEEKILILLDVKHWKRLVKQGKLEILGKRNYRYN
ncbi:MAG: hypothetical protein ACE5KT_06335 [Methanosarcinales archaeon]